MPSVPRAVLLLVLSAASWQSTHPQQIPDEPSQPVHPSAQTDLSTAAVLTNSSLTTTAAELLSSALRTLLSLSSSLVHSLPATMDSLYTELSSIPLTPVSSLFTSAGVSSSSSSSAPHDHTIPVLLFLLVALFVLLLLLTAVTIAVWQRYAADIADFKVEWHSTRARHRARRADKREREKDGSDARHSSGAKDSSDRHSTTAAAAAVVEDRRDGRQSSEHLYGFISRARAISDADDEVEMRTPTVIVPGRDPFSQLRRKH